MRQLRSERAGSSTRRRTSEEGVDVERRRESRSSSKTLCAPPPCWMQCATERNEVVYEIVRRIDRFHRVACPRLCVVGLSRTWRGASAAAVPVPAAPEWF